MATTEFVQVTPPNPQPPKKNFFAFIEWGVLELGFVIVLLGIIFFTLNYFNILQLSNLSSRFSLLPQASIKPSPIPTLNPNLFAYNFPMADDLLTKYVYSTLQPAYLPTASPSSNIGLTQSHETFTGNWLKGKNTFVRVTFAYTKFTDVPNYYKIYTSLTDLPNFPPTSSEELAQKIIPQVYITSPIPNTWQCKAKDKTIPIQCNLTTNDSIGQKDFAVDLQQTASFSAVLSVTYCFIPNESFLDTKTFRCED